MTAQTSALPASTQPGGGRRAAQKATDRNTVRVQVPVVGTIELPPTNELAFLGGVGLLAVVGALEWPIAGVLAAGHLLAASRRNKVLHDFGEALEEA
ncbi:MAG: hypothetical protein ACLGIA_04625 [Actinomycetes bacterium]